MNEYKVFGSILCPDCPPFLEYLDKNEIKYEFLDITKSLKNY